MQKAPIFGRSRLEAPSLEIMPDLPTVTELGPGLRRQPPDGAIDASWNACRSHHKRGREVEHAPLADPMLSKKIRHQGADPPLINRQQCFSKLIVDETKRFGDLVREIGLQVD